MADIPHAVLSEHLEEKLRGRRLLAAVFVTFRFDPEFFEQEILPVFLDVPLSHAAAIKLVQLDAALPSVTHGVAVYYDHCGLVPEAGPSRLPVKRIAVRNKTALFHPKNVFALVEEREPNKDGHRAQALIAASMSANLTRAGWWENVEVCHTEEIRERDSTRVRDDLVAFLEGLERRVGEKASDGHSSLRAIRSFLRSTFALEHRSAEGKLHTHFFDGRTSVVEFLDDAAGGELRGMNLEVISPYLDDGPELKPLADLIDAFEPPEVRVFLPTKESGDALCSRDVFDWVRRQEGVSWGHLPQDLLRGGKSKDARQRMVHAKVYRFFTPQPKREILFIGSVNLTTAAHQNGGNLETGFLVEVQPVRRPDWWLIADSTRPRQFDQQDEDEGASTSGGTKLSIRFQWNAKSADAFWDDAAVSPATVVSAQGVELFRVEGLPSRTWQPLSKDACVELERVLRSTSLLSVVEGHREPGLLLVQEEGMWDKPSLLLDLSPAEILRYWSLLTLAQQAAFLEARAPEIAALGDGAALVTRFEPLAHHDSFFDRFAGIFLAFGAVERSVRVALREGRMHEATYRLFGQKYDSLGTLLNRVMKDAAEDKGDLVEHYVMALCARQLSEELRKESPKFFSEHAAEARRLQDQLESAASIRDRLVARDPARMAEFLDWFDHWFLRRAAPLPPEAQ